MLDGFATGLHDAPRAGGGYRSLDTVVHRSTAHRSAGSVPLLGQRRRIAGTATHFWATDSSIRMEALVAGFAPLLDGYRSRNGGVVELPGGRQGVPPVQTSGLEPNPKEAEEGAALSQQ